MLENQILRSGLSSTRGLEPSNVKANVTFLEKLSQDEMTLTMTLTMLGLQNPEYESAQSEHLFTLREKSHRAT